MCIRKTQHFLALQAYLALMIASAFLPECLVQMAGLEPYNNQHEVQTQDMVPHMGKSS